jgi:uncharacterized repeat protein (TIGR01451 family)
MRHMQRIVMATLLLFGAWAQAGPATKGSIELKLVAEVEQEYQEKGVTKTRLVPVATAVPGTEVIYTITYRNLGAQPAENVVIANPIPTAVVLREGSAFGSGTDIEFSADGGKTWGRTGEVRIKGADGIERTAGAADYTHLRWRVMSPVAPKATGFVRYRAILR